MPEWRGNYSGHLRFDPDADDAALGVPVTREVWNTARGGRCQRYFLTALVDDIPVVGTPEPGLWLPLSDAAQQARREIVCKALNAILDDEEAVEATIAALAALGLGAA